MYSNKENTEIVVVNFTQSKWKSKFLVRCSWTLRDDHNSLYCPNCCIVFIPTSVRAGRTGVWVPVGAEGFIILNTSRPDLGRTQPLLRRVPGFLSLGVKEAERWRPHHFHLLQRSRLSGPIPLLPSFTVYSWRVRDNFSCCLIDVAYVITLSEFCTVLA